MSSVRPPSNPTENFSIFIFSSRLSQRLVIRETTAGLAKFLLESNPNAKKEGVVIGYDGRHGSKICEFFNLIFNSVGVVRSRSSSHLSRLFFRI